MVLNHYFTLVDKSFPQKENLLRRGYIFHGPSSHKGQGTSAEFVLFPKNYFEYIWVDDHEASKNNLLQLYKREHQSSCKYGLCFSGALPREYKKDFILYTPPYSPKTKILVLQESLVDLRMPLIFISANSSDPKESEPQNNKNLSPKLFNSQNMFFLPEDIKDYKIPDFFMKCI